MFKYNNNHIFTGYLKQLLSSVHIPTCKIYTKAYADYLETYGKEDPRVIESFDSINKNLHTSNINYLKGNELYKYTIVNSEGSVYWKHTSNIYYDSSKRINGLTKTLNSPGIYYDSDTHEYLGEFLRFMRDYHYINLMSLYNCFSEKIVSNINISFNVSHVKRKENEQTIYKKIEINSNDDRYHIYAIPVKLFENYTIAIDSIHGLELFCGIYNTKLDTSAKGLDLITRTYEKINESTFSRPFIYNKLDVSKWPSYVELATSDLDNTKIINRWDIANREQDLKLFIKVPVQCKSSITVLEGNFVSFNDFKYMPPGVYTPGGLLIEGSPDTDVFYKTNDKWEYKNNHTIINFNKDIDLNDTELNPISRLQLLALNTGVSYPFADRLIEYLVGSTITPSDTIYDNVKRAQRVMEQNQHYFRIEGLWEDKMRKIIYDYIINSGPISTTSDGKLIDRRSGYHRVLGHNSKSYLYDILGYVDRDAEKYYASWTQSNNISGTKNNIKVKDTIKNIDIYDKLYDL